MPVVGISVKEASWKGITTMLESKDPSLEKSKFQKICKKNTFHQISCLSYASGNDESQGPDSMPRRLSWGVAKSLLLQILLSFETDKPDEQTQTDI